MPALDDLYWEPVQRVQVLYGLPKATVVGPEYHRQAYRLGCNCVQLVSAQEKKGVYTPAKSFPALVYIVLS